MINPILSDIPTLPAYIDAGTGALIIQFLIAGAVAGLFFIKGYWRKVRDFLRRGKKDND